MYNICEHNYIDNMNLKEVRIKEDRSIKRKHKKITHINKK
jgi:hypothetical protein